MSSIAVKTVTMLTGLLLIAVDLEAVPAYSRKHQVACSQCHSAWPLLNRFGRTFKENGYRLDREPVVPDPAAPGETPDITIDERLSLARTLPVSFRVQSRPIVKRSTDTRFDMQVVHEFELQITDAAGGNLSYFANIEAADDEGWSAGMKDLTVGWHPRPHANLVGGYGHLTFTDPYNTFASRRLTQDRPSPNGAGFQSGYRFRDATQFGSLYGRAGGLFYSATVGTGASDPVGADMKDYFLRAAYDLPGGFSVGTFSLIGDKELTSPVRIQEYSRSGVDFQVDTHGFTANAAWYRAQEELATTLVEQENDAWYFQTFYVMPTPIPLVPMFRFESVESSNGSASTDQVAFTLLAYVQGNVNVSLDYITQVKVPGTAKKSNRFSVLFMVGM